MGGHCFASEVVVVEVSVGVAVAFRSEEDGRVQIGNTQAGVFDFVRFHLVQIDRNA